MNKSLIAVLLLLAGCRSTTDSAGVEMLSTIRVNPDAQPAIEISTAGRTAVITFTTYGGGCYSVAETRIEQNGMAVTIRPFDNTGQCTDRILTQLTHESTIVFPSSGAAHVSVIGLDATSASASDLTGDTITVSREFDLP